MEQALADAARRLEEFRNDPRSLAAMDAIASAIVQSFQNGGKALSAGNGGSMADAMHFAEEFSGRFRNDRVALPALALSDPSHLTCVSNDYGFDHVFSRMVQALGKPQDLLLLLSTSGNSRNLILAAEAGREIGLTVVGCLGRGGGELASRCDVVLHAPGEGSDRVQEIHMLALHSIIEEVERRMGLA